MARRITQYRKGNVTQYHTNIVRIISFAVVTLLASLAFISAAPYYAYDKSSGYDSVFGISNFANNAVSDEMMNAFADDGTDFKAKKGEEGLDYDGCPGNDGKDSKGDNKDNDARQICALKKKDNGKSGKLGDAEWNYNNLTGNVSQKEKDDPNSQYNHYGNDNGERARNDTSVQRNFIETFFMLIHRTIDPFYYINHDIPASDSSNKDDVLKWISKTECSSLDKDSAYDNDNCDIPGIATQAVQDIVDLIFPQGIQNGAKYSASTPFNIGLPVGLLPGSTGDGNDVVPVDGKRGANKYTGLEILGYNLKWTSYAGEWDKIDVLPADRLAANINLFTTVVAAAALAAQNVAQDFGDMTNEVKQGLSEGNLFKVAGAILGFIVKAVADLTIGFIYFFINGVINGFENSIVKKSAWNRNDFYRNTSYNVRMLPDIDQAAIYKFITMTLTMEKNAEKAKNKGADMDSVKKQAEFFDKKNKPSNPKYLKIPKGASEAEKNEAYKKAWTAWINDNKDKFLFAAQNLGIKDPMKYFKTGDSNSDATKGTKNDAGDTSSSDSSKGATLTPLDTAYEELRQDWGKASTAYINNYSKDYVKNHQDFGDGARNAVSWLSFGLLAKNDEQIAQMDREEIEKKAKELLANNAIFYFCTNANDEPTVTSLQAGGDTGNKTVNYAIAAGMVWPGLAAFDIKDGKATPKDCAAGKMRPPIVGGMNGSMGTDAQIQANTDTRRSAWKSPSIFDLIGLHSGADSMARDMLAVSQKITMGINFLVNLSFTPLLEQLGIKDVLIDVVDTLRESFYMQCLSIFITFGAVFVLFRYTIRGRNRNNYFMGIREVLVVCFVGIIGLVMLLKPAVMFKLFDEYPSYAERAMAAVIMQSSFPNADLCSATGSPVKGIDASKYTDFEGNSTSFNPNDTIRTLECNVWDAFVLEPWSIGQFGVGHNQLYMQGSAPVSSINKSSIGEVKTDEKTQTLVGKPYFDMGGGQKMYNWAIYQLTQTLGGTATTNDATQVLLRTNTGMYRLVDLQAGPKKAQGKDTRFWMWWIGKGNRFAVGAMALMTSVAGIFTIATFAILKLEATFNMSLLFAISPFMLLIGLVPGSGRYKMKSWAFKILALAFKRVVLVALMCIQLLVIIHIANNGSTNGAVTMVFVTAVCILFAMYKTQIINMFLRPIDAKIGSSFSDMDSRIRDSIKGSRLANAAKSFGRTMPRAAGTAFGGLIAGGYSPFRNSGSARLNRWENEQRQKARDIYDASMSEINNERNDIVSQYNHGLLTNGNYSKKMSDLNDRAAKAAVLFKDNIHNINDQSRRFDTDFNFKQAIMNDDSLKEGGEIKNAMKEGVNKAMNNLYESNHRNGTGHDFADIYREVKKDKERLVQNAYNNIITNNPMLYEELMGNNAAGDAARKMLKNVDFRKINNMLRMDYEHGRQLSFDEMASLGIKYTYDKNGKLHAVLPSNIRDQFRRTVLEQADDNLNTKGAMLKVPEVVAIKDSELKDKKAGNKNLLKDPESSKPITTDRDKLHARFRKVDVSKERIREASRRANKYLINDKEKLNRMQKIVRNNLSGAALSKFNEAMLSSTVLSDVKQYGAVDVQAHDAKIKKIASSYDSKIDSIRNDNTISKDEKAKRIKELENKKRKDVEKTVNLTTDAVIENSAVVADAMLNVNTNKFINDNKSKIKGVYIDRNTGDVKIDFAQGVSESDRKRLENSESFKEIINTFDDLKYMSSVANKNSSIFDERNILQTDGSFKKESVFESSDHKAGKMSLSEALSNNTHDVNEYLKDDESDEDVFALDRKKIQHEKKVLKITRKIDKNIHKKLFKSKLKKTTEDDMANEQIFGNRNQPYKGSVMGGDSDNFIRKHK